MFAAGWGIEVVTWEASCKRSLREWAEAKGCFIRLEDYYDSVTFIEGNRRAAAVDVSKRPVSRPRPNPAQVAEMKVKADYERQLAGLKGELEANKAKKRIKEQRKAKYEKRVLNKKR